VILAALLLVLAGAGLFVAGLLTGATPLYWACVAVCVLAAVLLVVARRQMTVWPAADASLRVPEPPTRSTTTPSGAVIQVGPTSTAPVQTAAAESTVVVPTTGRAPAVGPLPGDGSPAGDGTRGHGGPVDQVAPVSELGDPPVEEAEVTDLLLVVDVTDEVLVIDERPRYHLAGCVHLVGRTPIPLPLDEAKADGFTPCGGCEPDRNLAERVRARRSAGNR
jgi:hypothetical protein